MSHVWIKEVEVDDMNDVYRPFSIFSCVRCGSCVSADMGAREPVKGSTMYNCEEYICKRILDQ